MTNFRKNMVQQGLSVLIITILITFSACGGESEEEREAREYFNQYIEELENFKSLIAIGRVHTEAITELIENIWAHTERETLNPQTLRYVVNLTDIDWDNIEIPATTAEIVAFLEENNYTINNFNEALFLFNNAQSTAEMRNDVDQARANIDASRERLANPPEELKQASETAGFLIESFYRLRSLAENPSSNLSEYVETRNETIAQLITYQRQLGEQIEAAKNN